MKVERRARVFIYREAVNSYDSLEALEVRFLTSLSWNDFKGML